tara:strand:- start:211 stop:927 length:717 start_codon:yes stop_codon:yes gene_type:complete
MQNLFENWRRFLSEEEEGLPFLNEGSEVLKQKYIDQIKARIPDEEVTALLNILEPVMNSKKYAHSVRVAAMTTELPSSTKDMILGALFHDYVERIPGCVDDPKHPCLGDLPISDLSKKYISALSSAEKNKKDKKVNQPLEHIKAELEKVSDDKTLKNTLILIKISDRMDNLRSRSKSGGVSKSYLRKSIDLIADLKKLYTAEGGDAQNIEILLAALKKKLLKKINKGVEKKTADRRRK